MADWANLPANHPLTTFASELQPLLDEAQYVEMYGVELSAPTEGCKPAHSTLIILQKFLRANAADIPKAKTQLLEALKWRKKYNPLAAREEHFSIEKFGGLGYVVKIPDAKGTGKGEEAGTVATFNVYGAAAKEPKKAFGDTDAFIRWRVALMELTLSHLPLSTTPIAIPDYGTGPDPHTALQIHDYLSVSFFRQPAEIKAASQSIIKLFQRVYPETVGHKYFVNVPWVMQWMMGAMKALSSADAVAKMTWMGDGGGLVGYVGEGVPREYGGKGGILEEAGETVKWEEGMEKEDDKGDEAAKA